MNITINVACKDAEEAHEVINLLTRRHKTWVDHRAETATQGQEVGEPVVVHVKKMSDGTLRVPDRVNTSPGFVACQKIGSETKELLLAALPSSDPDHIAKKIKRTPDQTRSFLQLMWDRGLIKFDGMEFYK